MKAKVFYDRVDSTMAELTRLVENSGPNDSFCVRAGVQTAGRGRDANLWHSPPGGLWLSFDLHYPMRIPSFALYAGACLHALLQRLFGLPGLRIKWPNDIYLDDKKLAGILCEHKEQLSRYLIGIGVNTNVARDTSLAQYAAAILSDHLGFPVSNTLLADLLVQEIERNSGQLKDPASHIAYVNRWLYGKGRLAQVLAAGETVTGRVAEVASDGSLLLLDAEGKARGIYTGNLQLL